MTMGLTKIQYTPEELQKKREEAERKVFGLFLFLFENVKSFLLKLRDLNKLIKARRGEIEPTHDFTFSLIGIFY